MCNRRPAVTLATTCTYKPVWTAGGNELGGVVVVEPLEVPDEAGVLALHLYQATALIAR